MQKKKSLEKRIKEINSTHQPLFVKGMQIGSEALEFLKSAKYTLKDAKGVEALVITNPQYWGKMEFKMNRPPFKMVNDYHYSHNSKTGEIEVGFRVYDIFPFSLSFVPNTPQVRLRDRDYALDRGILAGIPVQGATIIRAYNGVKTFINSII